MCDFRSKGGLIALLKKGDEIILKEGFGYPKADADSEKIIAAVDLCSAVTADGTRLKCHDSVGVIVTGKQFDDFELSDSAREIIRDARNAKVRLASTEGRSRR